MKKLIKKLIFPLCLCFCVLTVTVTSADSQKKSYTNEAYVLKSYKNTVALYKQDEIITVYQNVVLNTLPEKDRLNFKKGIPVSDPSQAEILLEDFDR